MKRLIPLASIFVAVLTGCARFDPLRGLVGPYRSYTEIKGNLQDGRYTSPHNNFSCKVPDLEKPGAVIKDDINKKDKKNLPKATMATDSRAADQSTLFCMTIAEVPGVKVYIPPSQRDTVTKEMVMPRIFRGHLIFRRGAWVYALTSQTEAKFSADKVKTTEEQGKEVRSKLEELLADFDFK